MGSTIRNHNKPDPALVVANIRHVLDKQNMALLQKGSYEFLITHTGFIAHYDQQGFIETFKDDLPSFVHQFLSQGGMGWSTWLNDKASFLYDVSYKGKLLAEIVQELILIFQAYEPAIKSAHTLHRESDQLSQLHAMADCLGYDLVKRKVA